MLKGIFSSLTPWALFPLRVILGFEFLMSGGRKLFVIGFQGVGAYFTTLGIPGAGFWGVAIPLLEFLGGIAVLLGIFTRYIAAALSIDMVVAIFTVHISAGFFLPRGYAYALALLGGCLTFLLAGPGRGSLDAALGREETL